MADVTSMASTFSEGHSSVGGQRDGGTDLHASGSAGKWKGGVSVGEGSANWSRVQRRRAARAARARQAEKERELGVGSMGESGSVVNRLRESGGEVGGFCGGHAAGPVGGSAGTTSGVGSEAVSPSERVALHRARRAQQVEEKRLRRLSGGEVSGEEGKT